MGAQVRWIREDRRFMYDTEGIAVEICSGDGEVLMRHVERTSRMLVVREPVVEEYALIPVPESEVGAIMSRIAKEGPFDNEGDPVRVEYDQDKNEFYYEKPLRVIDEGEKRKKTDEEVEAELIPRLQEWIDRIAAAGIVAARYKEGLVGGDWRREGNE